MLQIKSFRSWYQELWIVPTKRHDPVPETHGDDPLARSMVGPQHLPRPQIENNFQFPGLMGNFEMSPVARRPARPRTGLAVGPLCGTCWTRHSKKFNFYNEFIILNWGGTENGRLAPTCADLRRFAPTCADQDFFLCHRPKLLRVFDAQQSFYQPKS